MLVYLGLCVLFREIGKAFGLEETSQQPQPLHPLNLQNNNSNHNDRHASDALSA